MRNLASINGAPLDGELAQQYFDALPERARALLGRLEQEANQDRSRPSARHRCRNAEPGGTEPRGIPEIALSGEDGREPSPPNISFRPFVEVTIPLSRLPVRTASRPFACTRSGTSSVPSRAGSLRRPAQNRTWRSSPYPPLPLPPAVCLRRQERMFAQTLSR